MPRPVNPYDKLIKDEDSGEVLSRKEYVAWDKCDQAWVQWLSEICNDLLADINQLEALALRLLQAGKR